MSARLALGHKAPFDRALVFVGVMLLRAQRVARIPAAASLDVAPPAAGATSCIRSGLLEDLDLVWAAQEPQTTLSGASKNPLPDRKSCRRALAPTAPISRSEIREPAQPPHRRGDFCLLIFRLDLFAGRSGAALVHVPFKGNTVNIEPFPGFVELQAICSACRRFAWLGFSGVRDNSAERLRQLLICDWESVCRLSALCKKYLGCTLYPSQIPSQDTLLPTKSLSAATVVDRVPECFSWSRGNSQICLR